MACCTVVVIRAWKLASCRGENNCHPVEFPRFVRTRDEEADEKKRLHVKIQVVQTRGLNQTVREA